MYDYPTAKDLYKFEYNMKSRPHVAILGVVQVVQLYQMVIDMEKRYLQWMVL